MTEELPAASRHPVVLVLGHGPWADQVGELLREHDVAVPVPAAVDLAAEALTQALPAVAVVTDADPGDRALIACLAAGVPVVDVHRSIASVDRARRGMKAGTLVAAVGWGGGVPAMVAAAAHDHSEHDHSAPGPVDHVEIDVLVAPGDLAGRAWWLRFAGLHRSFMVYDQGQRRLVRGLGEPKVVAFAGGRRRARRIASPEQETLVETGLARSAAVRVAFARRRTNLWLTLLVGSGAWRFVPVTVRAGVLKQPPGAAAHEVVVTWVRGDRAVRARVVDPRGRAHLVAAGAAVQVRRLLDPGRTVPTGVSHPEEAGDLPHDLEALRAMGVVIEHEILGPTKEQPRG